MKLEKDQGGMDDEDDKTSVEAGSDSADCGSGNANDTDENPAPFVIVCTRFAYIDFDCRWNLHNRAGSLEIIFTLMFVICALALFGAAWVMVTLETANDNLRGFVRG